MAQEDDRNVEKQRRCLRCEKYFSSRSAANRLCKKCAASNADEHVPKSAHNFLPHLDGDPNRVDDENI
jgi:hypothetical protein